MRGTGSYPLGGEGSMGGRQKPLAFETSDLGLGGIETGSQGGMKLSDN